MLYKAQNTENMQYEYKWRYSVCFVGHDVLDEM